MHKHYHALSKTPANYVPLSPLSFLRRAGQVFADREAVVYGNNRFTWGRVLARCQSLASSLNKKGLGIGDTVSVFAPNIPAVFELHFAVPLAGCVLNSINTRLEPETVAYILGHSDSQLIFADTALAAQLRAAFTILGREIEVIDIEDDQANTAAGFGVASYEQLIAEGDAEYDGKMPEDEWQAISLNYTSGTSGRPKGVVYHHRGAYLMSMGTIAAWQMNEHSTYLSVVPLFHCNGWGHPWAMAMVGAKMVFTRDPKPDLLFQAITEESVTHFGAAPVVLSMLADSPAAPEKPFSPPVRVLTAGAPPPPIVLARTHALGFDVMQVYGLTETFGHISQCLWQEDWAALSLSDQSEMQAMQGVSFPMVEEVSVFDRELNEPVPNNGQSLGQTAIRGNTVMKGYYKDPEATKTAFADGYFWSGDVAVVHRNGYMQIRDRLKDVIISGGENISSVEIENVLFKHPAVQSAAVVAMPHIKWGETPCAFIEQQSGMNVTEVDIINFCKQELAGFKVPKAVVFGELPKTATGKVQKYLLKEKARAIVEAPA